MVRHRIILLILKNKQRRNPLLFQLRIYFEEKMVVSRDFRTEKYHNESHQPLSYLKTVYTVTEKAYRFKF